MPLSSTYYIPRVLITTIRTSLRLIPSIPLQNLVGARHVIQRQFIHGFDVINDNRPIPDNKNIYLMEFM
jgi:hypothetical protein